MDKKSILVIVCIICSIILSSCSTERNIVVNLPERTSSPTEESTELVYTPAEIILDIEEENLKVIPLKSYISLVDSSCKDFYKLIENNAIDRYYVNETIPADSYVGYAQKNEYYYVDWYEETQYSYANFIKNTNTNASMVERQNEQYFKYLDGLSNIYKNNFNDYSIDKSTRIALSSDILNKVRAYTVLIKEYEYLCNGVTYFEHTGDYENKGIEEDSVIKKESYLTVDKYLFVSDSRFADSVNDYYYDVDKEYKTFNGTDDEIYKEVKEYYEYWDEEYKRLYNIFLESVDGEQKKSVEETFKYWRNYLEVAYSIQGDVLNRTTLKDTLMSDDTSADLVKFKADALKGQSLSLLQYIYLLDGTVAVE